MKRDLDGVYFRTKNKDGKWDSICFSDLTDEQQDEVLKDRSEEWLKSLCKHLAHVISEIGEQFDLICEHVEDEKKEEIQYKTFYVWDENNNLVPVKIKL